MNATDFSELRQRRLAELEVLESETDQAADARKTVTLDQQAVGRLSRMDAMQQQAMAQAQERRRDQHRLKIQATLARIDEGEYGFCTDCGEDIAPKRLELDPTVARCLSCARG